jgi:hypothetical protein
MISESQCGFIYTVYEIRNFLLRSSNSRPVSSTAAACVVVFIKSEKILLFGIFLQVFKVPMS